MSISTQADPLRGRPVKWTIPPPICELGDGRFADRVYFDAEGKSTQLCTPHFNNALDTEILARDQLRDKQKKADSMKALDQMKKDRLAKLEAESK